MARKNKNYYFRQEHEDAIVEYVDCKDRDRREYLYRELLNPAFTELIDKIVATKRHNTLPNIDYLKEECKMYLMGVLDKFDPTRKTAAFSYFTRVVMNWFTSRRIKTEKKKRIEVSREDINEVDEGAIEEENYVKLREKREFWDFVLSEIDRWIEESDSDRQKRVLSSIKIILNDKENMDDDKDFHKKKIYLYLREISLLDSRKISQEMSKIRALYRESKERWVSEI